MAEFSTYEEMAKNVAEKALDDFLYNGKSIREWMQIIASEDCIRRKQLVRELNAQVAVNAITKETAQDMLDHLPSIQPTAKENLVVENCISREFIEIVVEYPPADLCTYPEYRGKPYFSIKYRENGKGYVGFGTYKIEFLSQWIKEYFISVTPQPKTEWIPVSERLPEPFSFVNCTCHSLIDDREDWVVETFYFPLPPDSPYSDWGNIPMLNWGECEVTAWMYRDIPKPYKAEREKTE